MSPQTRLTDDLAGRRRGSDADGPLAPRIAIGGLLLIAGLDMLLLALLWPGVAGINDFVGLLAGGRAILGGVDPYDPAVWTAFATSVGQPPETAVFGYPPWTALLFVPFALLPTVVAALVWTAGGLALATVACVVLARRAGWPIVPSALLAAVSWPATLVFLQGQWGYLLVVLMVAAILALGSGRYARAGVLWGLMVLAKPHLFLFASLVLGLAAIARRRPVAIAAATATIALGVVAGTLVSPRWVVPYAGLVLAKRGVRQTQEPTLAGLAGDVAGDAWPVAWTLAVVVLAIAVASAARAAPSAQRERVFVAGIVTLSVVAAPYAWSYDHYLAVPLAMAVLGLAATLDRGRRLALTVIVVSLFGPVAFALWESSYVRWHDTLAALVPVLIILVAWIAARWTVSGADGMGSPLSPPASASREARTDGRQTVQVRQNAPPDGTGI